MEKYLFIILFLFFAVHSNAQQRKNIIFLDAVVMPADSNSNCIITFKITYQHLLFKKNGSGYLSGITLNMEISSAGKKTIYKSISKGVFLNNYQQTLSKDNYLEGLVNLSLLRGRYKLKSTLIVKYLKKFIELPKLSFVVEDDSLKSLRPLLVGKEPYACNNQKAFKLLNFGKIFPFSPSSKMLIFPIIDTTVSAIKISIFQNKKKILVDSIAKYVKREIKLAECNDKLTIVLGKKSSSAKFFILENIEKYLDEGKVKIVVGYGNNKSQDFYFNTVWLNKPIILRNTKFAISLIKTIWGKHDIDKILKLDNDKQYVALKKYLSKYDTDTSTKFNEVMSEFYNRVDYAIFNFGNEINKTNALSDMGQTYIKFGKPDTKERIYSKRNNVMEIWNYNKPKRKFIFVDKVGLGNYKFINRK